MLKGKGKQLCFSFSTNSYTGAVTQWLGRPQSDWEDGGQTPAGQTTKCLKLIFLVAVCQASNIKVNAGAG